jgi:hypothetical protein
MGLYAFRQMNLVPPVKVCVSAKNDSSYLVAYPLYPGTQQLVKTNTKIFISPRKAYSIVLGFRNMNHYQVYINDKKLDKTNLIKTAKPMEEVILFGIYYGEYSYKDYKPYYVISQKQVVSIVYPYYAWLILGFLSLVGAYIVLRWQKAVFLDTIVIVLPSVWLSFITFPGIVSGDTIYQWVDSTRNYYTNWHPPLMSYIASHLVGVISPALGMTFLQLLILFTGILLIAKFFYTGTKRYLLYFFLLVCPIVLNIGLGPDKDYFFACAFILSIGLILQLNSTETWVSYGTALASIFFTSLIRYDGPLFVVPLIIFLVISYFKIKKFQWNNLFFIVGLVSLINVSCFLFGQAFTYMKTHKGVPQGHLSEVLVPQIAAATMDKKILAGLNMPIIPDTKNYPSPLAYCSSYRNINWSLLFLPSPVVKIKCQKFYPMYNSAVLYQWLCCWIQHPLGIFKYDLYNTWQLQRLSLLNAAAISEYAAMNVFMPKVFYPPWFEHWMHLSLLTRLPLYSGTGLFLILFGLARRFKNNIWGKYYYFISKLFFISIFFMSIRFFIFTYINYRFVALLPILYWLAVGSTLFILIDGLLYQVFAVFQADTFQRKTQ